MSGRDLARALVGQRAGLPVIIVSGYTQEALREGGEAVAPPSKPFTSGELRQKVGDVLRRGRRADPAGGPLTSRIRPESLPILSCLGLQRELLNSPVT